MKDDLQLMLAEVLREGLAPIHKHLEKIDGRLDQIDSRLDQVDSRLDQIDNRLDQIDGRLDRIEADQVLIKAAVLDTNERVMRLEEVAERQTTVIELLSARSIEHEAQLKRIK